MSDPSQHQPSAPEHPDWNVPLPEVIPAPTAWPASLALGSTLLLWGFATSLIISGIGLGVFAVSIGGWIGDIRHERRTTK